MNTFLKNLGKSITEGIVERRISRHNEELKHFNKLLASPQYFLLKECLVFTCEQMQLPREALREYKEMEAIIPVGSRDGDTGNLNPAEAKLIIDLATAGRIVDGEKKDEAVDSFYDAEGRESMGKG